jgi:hypothetical protein
MASDDSKVSKVQTYFQTLASVAPALNAASDELTRSVGILDEALKKLNIGLSVWVPFRYREPDESPDVYDRDQIGYAKVEGQWGIALIRIWGNESADVHHQEGPWLFNYAPRELRLLGVDTIPEVIDALGKEAWATTKRLQDKTRDVRDLAAAIDKISKLPAPPPYSKLASLSELLKVRAEGEK